MTVKNDNKDEITVRELIMAIKHWCGFLVKKWKIILSAGIIGAGIGLAYASFETPSYSARLTFVLEDNKQNTLGAYAGIASQLGINLNTASNGIFSGDNIIEFLRSRLMIEKALLSPINVNNKIQTLADYYIEFQYLRKSWENRKDLQDIHFPVNANRQKFSLQQDSILNNFYSTIKKKYLSIDKVDKNLNFIEVVCQTPDEKFSKYFVERLVAEATDFYIKTKTKRSKSNVNILQKKADSISFLLNRKAYSTAASQDLNINPAKRVATVSTELMLVDKAVLQTMYGEVLKNLEMSKFSMSQETPIIQLVDTPIFPLRKEKLGRLNGVLLGGGLGGFLTILILVARRQYAKIMQ